MLSASPTWAIASATQTELRRRPGLQLAVLAAGCLLMFLQRLSSSFLGASTGLTTELSLATAGLFLSVVAGVAGVRAAADGDELGTTTELLAAPISRNWYLMARLGGIIAWTALALVALTAFAATGHALAGVGGDPPVLSDILLANVGILTQAVAFASIGMLAGALVPVPLATVLLLAFVVGSRLLIPTLAESHGAVRWIALALPDPMRLDFAREVGFSRPINSGSVWLALVGSLLQSAAMVVLATAGLHRREG